MRLFGDRRFRPYHDDEGGPDHRRRTPWRREKVPIHAKPLLRSLLQRGLYCDTCRRASPRAARKLARQFLHCSGCDTQQPDGLFSLQQRRGPSKSRICIGREGYVRLCDDGTIAWSHVEECLTDPSRAWRMTCRDPSHKPDLSPHGSDTLYASVFMHTSDKSHKKSAAPGRLTQWTRWSTHVQVPGFAKRNGVNTADLVRLVELLRQSGVWYIVPDNSRMHLIELWFFDPNFSIVCVQETLGSS
jgi:hypothetical protein